VKLRDEEFLILFGNHLKNLRVANGLTQEELAWKSELSLSQIARIETGKVNPTLCTIKILAKSLNMHISELVNIQTI
jgi:transcriptional regulator with XRE-family HTH domain